MKAYTDLEQSRKLADILPIESADMHYNVVGDAIIGDYQSEISSARSVAKAYKKNPDEFAKNVIPCWSLAALLKTLPLEVEIHKQTDGHKIYYYVESYMKRMEKEIYLSTERYENLVDACVEMIIMLHEQKLL